MCYMTSDLRKARAEALQHRTAAPSLYALLAYSWSSLQFHMWAPDVYEGAPTSVTASFYSVLAIMVTTLG